MFRNFGPGEILILVLLLVIVLGWKKLPDAARSVGRSMRIFKSEVEEMKNDGKPSPSPAARETVSGNVVTDHPATAPVPPPTSSPTTPRDTPRPADRPAEPPGQSTSSGQQPHA